jgi:Lysine-specific metallo-endopeptidase
MATLEGFGFFEKRAVRKAMMDGGRALDKALAEAFSNNDAFLKRMDDYFGAGGGGVESSSHLVMKTINSMKLTIDSDIYRIMRAGADPTTNADMENVPQREVKFKGTAQKKARTTRWQGTTDFYVGEEINVLEAIMRYANASAKPIMRLFDLFFNLPYKRLDAQSQVETFLHELSHMAAGTHDVDAPKCYGYNGVMYCKSAGKGAMNAESYGMFLQSYIV